MDKVHTKAQGSQPGDTLKGTLGPLTLRDTLVIIGGLLVLAGSLVPIPWAKGVSVNMWIFPGLPFHLFVSLLLPLGIVGGFLWRRLTGRTKVRIGSLSLDQAGSVVSLFAAAYFFNSYVASMSPAYLLGLIGALAMVVGTTLAGYLGAFRRDFVSGGDSVLGADVHPMASATKKAKTPEAEARPESLGVSSSGGTGTTSGGRPGKPLTGKKEERPETTSAAVPAADVGTATGPAAEKPAGEKKDKAQEAKAASATPKLGAPAAGAGKDKNDKGTDNAVATPLKTDAPGVDKSAASTSRVDAAKSGSALDRLRAQAPAAGTPKTATGPETAKEKSGAQEPSTKKDAKTLPGTAEKSVAGSKESAEAKSVGQEESSESGPGQADKDSLAGRGNAPTAGDGSGTKPEQVSSPNATPSGDAAARPTAGSASGAVAGSATAAGQAKSGAQAEDPTAAATRDSVHPSTKATPRAQTDLKATAALSRADIAAHQASVERAKAESESSFGAKAEAHEPEEEITSFWFALNQSRPVFHPANGTMLAKLNPGKWILCLEDRGTEYLISLPDGRPAVLRNLDDLQFPEK